MQVALAALAGVLFGLGLAISRMVDPAVVLGFLDVTGAWDPSLALVMAGALAVTTPAFAWGRRHPRALLGAPLQEPARTELDARLVGGAILFGVGWGLVGFCPGPALASLALGRPESWIFAAALVAGSLAARVIDTLPARLGAPTAD